MGFVKSDVDPNLYYLVVENKLLILVLYVDDLFLTGSSILIEDCKKNLATVQYEGFGMNALLSRVGSLAAERRNLPWAREVCYRNPEKLIGSLMYLVNTRPNIFYAVNTLSQFMVEPKRAHWAADKHVLRYLQGTIDYGLLYSKGKDIRLSGFTNADWAGNSVDRKGTSRYCFNIGLGMTSWCSRKQKSVALSSSEAEYMATSIALCEVIWLRKLLVNLFGRNMEATMIMCDNQSCIKL
eukprot:PITA_14399